MIPFYKFQGTGNDFIIIDNRTGIANHLTESNIQFLCDRRFGVGADGLMLMQMKEGFDFEMIYFNADGRTSTLCGNGARCMVRFAAKIGLHQYTYRFLAIDGVHEAEIDNQNIVRLKMNDVREVEQSGEHFILNTGSPHFVKLVHHLNEVDVVETGRNIRYSKAFEQEGINVNLVESLGDDRIYVRTYERGVEDETLSCGTGVTAAALISAHNERGFNRIEVKTPGGNLSVEYNKVDDTTFENIWLCGPAEFVYEGEVEIH